MVKRTPFGWNILCVNSFEIFHILNMAGQPESHYPIVVFMLETLQDQNYWSQNKTVFNQRSGQPPLLAHSAIFNPHSTLSFGVWIFFFIL